MKYLALVYFFFLYAQADVDLLSSKVTNDFVSYELHRVNPKMTINQGALTTVKTISDLHPQHKSEWIREVLDVTVTVQINGQDKLLHGNSELLNQAQLDAILAADNASDINIKISYIPENNLKNNTAQLMEYDITIDPMIDAQYPGTPEELKAYLSEQGVMDIPTDIFREHGLSAMAFTVDESGHITDVKVQNTTDDEATDAILIEAVCNMPKWKAAQYADGETVAQNFVLTAGDMRSCMVNVLNIRKLPKEQ